MTVDSKNNKKLSEKHFLQNTERDNLQWTLQNPAFNTLMHTTEKDGVFISKGGNATITSKNKKLTMSIDGYNQLEMRTTRQSFHKLLEIICINILNDYQPKKLISISLRYYMELCNLKDVKKARKQIKQDLEILFRIRFSYNDDYNDKKSPNYRDIRLLDSKGIENSKIIVVISDSFYKILDQPPSNKRMLTNQIGFWISQKDNPNSFYLKRKLEAHFRININKKKQEYYFC